MKLNYQNAFSFSSSSTSRFRLSRPHFLVGTKPNPCSKIQRFCTFGDDTINIIEMNEKNISQNLFNTHSMDFLQYNKPCVYKIVCLINNKTYIGQTNNFLERIAQHHVNLRIGAHECVGLQKDWKRYQPKDFEFKIVDKSSLCNDLIQRKAFEKAYLEELVSKSIPIYNTKLDFLTAKTANDLKQISYKGVIYRSYSAAGQAMNDHRVLNGLEPYSKSHTLRLIKQNKLADSQILKSIPLGTSLAPSITVDGIDYESAAEIVEQGLAPTEEAVFLKARNTKEPNWAFTKAIPKKKLFPIVADGFLFPTSKSAVEAGKAISLKQVLIRINSAKYPNWYRVDKNSLSEDWYEKLQILIQPLQEQDQKSVLPQTVNIYQTSVLPKTIDGDQNRLEAPKKKKEKFNYKVLYKKETYTSFRSCLDVYNKDQLAKGKPTHSLGHGKRLFREDKIEGMIKLGKIPQTCSVQVNGRFFNSLSEVVQAGLAKHNRQVLNRINSNHPRYKGWLHLTMRDNRYIEES